MLFDHCVDRRFRRHLIGHEIQTMRERRWEKVQNSKLLEAASGSGFDSFLTLDKKFEYEQDLLTLPIPVILIDSVSNALPSLIPFAGELLKLTECKMERALFVVSQSGTILVSRPR